MNAVHETCPRLEDMPRLHHELIQVASGHFAVSLPETPGRNLVSRFMFAIPGRGGRNFLSGGYVPAPGPNSWAQRRLDDWSQGVPLVSPARKVRNVSTVARQAF